MPIELWKDIDGYEGFYQVSNLGRVRSLPRYVSDRRLGTKFLKGRDLSLTADSNGYVIVVLQRNGEKRSFKVHRLVTTAFLPNPENKPSVNHIDHNKANNCLSNLEWCTPKENTAHMHKHSRNYEAYGFDNPSTKISEDDVIQIRELAKTRTHVSIAKLFGVSAQHVDKIVSRQRRKTVRGGEITRSTECESCQ